jgi:hypothetical protein
MDKESQLKIRKPEPQGNLLAIFFLIIPIASLIWAFRTKIVFPVNQLDFFGEASKYVILSYILLWVLSYYKEIGKKNNKTLCAVSAFLFFLWFIGGIVAVAKINNTWDKSSEREFFVKAIETRKMSGGGRPHGSSSCLVKLEKEIFGEDYISIRYNECDDIRPNIDGIQMMVKDGYLGFPWKTSHSIVKDIEFYKKQLNIKDIEP